MGGGSSAHGERQVLAGTYIAEQTAPEQCTLTSATFATSKTKITTPMRERGFLKKRQQYAGMGPAGCTVLPALESIDQLLQKAGDNEPDEKRRGSMRNKDNAKNKKGDPSDVYERLYPKAGKRIRSSVLNEVVEKSNEDLVAWLSRPPKFSSSSSRNRSPESSHMESICSRGDSPNRSYRSQHDSYGALFDTAFHGIGTTPRKDARQYMPGKTGQRRQRPLAEQIRPIHISAESAVDALKASDRYQANKLKTVDVSKGSDHPKGLKHMVTKSINRTKTQELIGKDPKTAEEVSLRLSSTVSAMRPEGKEKESKDVKEAEAEGTLDCVSPATKMPLARRDAAEALRVFLFNGAQDTDDPHKHQIDDDSFYLPIGTKREVIRLDCVWKMLDDDNSGRVNFQEFRAFTVKNNMLKLADKVMGPLLGKKSSFTIEDMMRIIWPCATNKDVKTMKHWIDDYHKTNKRVKTPELIHHDEFDALMHNFKFFDQDKSGQVTFTELIASGLLDKDTAERYLAECDEDGSGELSAMEFCEMFCMAGHRAHPDCVNATDFEGNHICYEEGIGWLKKESWKEFLTTHDPYYSRPTHRRVEGVEAHHAATRESPESHSSNAHS